MENQAYIVLASFVFLSALLIQAETQRLSGAPLCDDFDAKLLKAATACKIRAEALRGEPPKPPPTQPVHRAQFVGHIRRVNGAYRCLVKELTKPENCNSGLFETFKTIACPTEDAFASGICELEGALDTEVLNELVTDATQPGVQHVGENLVQCLDAKARYLCNNRPMTWPMIPIKFEKAMKLLEEDQNLGAMVSVYVRCKPDLLAKCQDTNAIRNAATRKRVESMIRQDCEETEEELQGLQVDPQVVKEFCAGLVLEKGDHNGGAPREKTPVPERAARPTTPAPNAAGFVRVVSTATCLQTALIGYWLAR